MTGEKVEIEVKVKQRKNVKWKKGSIQNGPSQALKKRRTNL